VKAITWAFAAALTACLTPPTAPASEDAAHKAMTSPIEGVNGHLPPVVIQRVVIQNFRRVRLCYENGIKNNPNLQGRVTIKFVIGLGGAVELAKDGGSGMPDTDVIDCVVRSFSKLEFPPPEGGKVTVVYPIQFSPGDDADGGAEAGAK
jgi:hypothetical protein